MRDSFLPIGMSLAPSIVVYWVRCIRLTPCRHICLLSWDLIDQRRGEAEPLKIPVTIHTSHCSALGTSALINGFVALFFKGNISGPDSNNFVSHNSNSYRALIVNINCDRPGDMAFPQGRGIITNQISTPRAINHLICTGVYLCWACHIPKLCTF